MDFTVRRYMQTLHMLSKYVSLFVRVSVTFVYCIKTHAAVDAGCRPYSLALTFRSPCVT